ncbi:MAG: hypothetical protein KBC95_02090 [Candidatus Peribacteraceae bacterium]|nr:hypothetical protein [Candidatus Peribacteraceae bacterium]
MTPGKIPARRRKGDVLKTLILKLEHDKGRGTIHSGHHELDTTACDVAYEEKHVKVWAKWDDDQQFEPVALYIVEGESAQIPGTNVFVPYQEFEGTKIIELMVA